MMHMGGGAWVGYGLMRSMRQDAKIKDHKLPKGTTCRAIGFAKPYKAALTLLLVLIIIDAFRRRSEPTSSPGPSSTS